MDNFLYFILIGLCAGFLAGFIMKSGMGLVGDLIVGVIGAILGGWLFGVLGVGVGGGLAGVLITATVGACLLIAILRFISKKKP